MHFNATINMSDRKAYPLKQYTFEKIAKNLKDVAKLVFMKHKLCVFIFNEENFPAFFMLNPFIPNESKWHLHIHYYYSLQPEELTDSK